MTALEYFRILAPEFAATDDVTVGVWLSIAEGSANVGCLDAERQAQAVALLAAHNMTLAGRGGSAVSGAIVSEKEGDLSRTYAQGSFSSPYATTGYGMQYDMLASVCAAGGILTRIDGLGC